MAYFAPYFDAAGFHIPTFADLQEYALSNYASIYTQSVSENVSTFDIQQLNWFALMLNDAFQGVQLAINGMSALAAIGAQQDQLYKLNGIARLEASFSTAVVNVTGTPLATLNALVAQDLNGFLWTLPTPITLDGSGNATGLTATCQTIGAVAAGAGTITGLYNPTAGWASVTNPAAAAIGQPVEADSQFRARQAVSVELPSRSLVDGTLAAIATVPNVTRYNNGSQTVGGASPIENPTGAVDVFGNPAHSISMVVEGGTDAAVAMAIYLNKTPGCYLNGTDVLNVADPVTGAITTVRFFRPTYVPIYVSLNVFPISGYTSATTTAIKTAIANYLNELQLGENVTISGLYAAAMAVTPNILIPGFSIQALTAGTAPAPVGTTDIAIAFNAAASGVIGNVVVTVV